MSWFKDFFSCEEKQTFSSWASSHERRKEIRRFSKRFEKRLGCDFEKRLNCEEEYKKGLLGLAKSHGFCSPKFIEDFNKNFDILKMGGITSIPKETQKARCVRRSIRAKQ